jgi:hypothetical protein
MRISVLDEPPHHDPLVSEILCIIKTAGILIIMRDFKPGCESYRISVLEFPAGFDIEENESFDPGGGILANQPVC